ncbi:L-asparaginase [Georgenia subflava]|uniref:L-asparaginase n=2 Tax=Georgenia subflava TaxID=1622177 RepID=A0A6N7EKL8_9MICO|nr:L-asparaginase [Georgenia subflava]
MTPARSGEGVTPHLDAATLVAVVPGLTEMADVTAETLQRLPSASLLPEHLVAALGWARTQVADGAAGVVLTHGTDTMEESAYLLDLLWDRPEPLVLTGAMRPPLVAGADGPANVLAAVTVAVSEGARGLGVLVVMDDSAHLAAAVTKTRATGTGAFASPGGGAVGRVVESEYVPGLVPARSRPPALPQPSRTAVRVALLEPGIGDDGGVVDLVVEAGYDGLVLAGSGAGHVPEPVADAVGRAVLRLPVVVGSRTGSGTTATRTYGYAGSEVDLLARGAVMAGPLSPRKARVLLWTLLAGGADGAAVRAEFRRRGGAAGD